jgi:hypothetical protein
MHIGANTIFSFKVEAGTNDIGVNTPPMTPFREILNSATSSKSSLDQRKNLEDKMRERNYMLEAARENSQVAEELAYGYAHNSLAFALLDLSDRPNIRYSATGELVTPKTQEYFNRISQAVQQQCANLYRQEVAKKTPPAEILEKIFSFHDSMPKDFKAMLGI